jgi:hypothetical protein
VRSMDDQHSVTQNLEPELTVSTRLERAAL